MIEQHAVAYAERLGWAVFGVAADCRSPIKVEGRFEHGVKDATMDPTEIAERWRLHPSAMVALACGPVSGVFALDIDAKHGVDGFASLRQLVDRFSALPLTWTSTTPSGGEHRLFKMPPVFLRNKVGLRIIHDDGSVTKFPGLDIRAHHASIALPPSAKLHGAYRWRIVPNSVPLATAPAWLIDLAVDVPPPPVDRPRLRMSTSDRQARYVEAAINGECNDLARMKPGSGRNLRLFQAAANLGGLVGAKLLSQDVAERALRAAAQDCGLLQEDGAHAVNATITSGMRKGISNPREVAA